MSNNNEKHTQDPEVVIENAISTTELFFEKHGKKIIIAIIAILIVVGAFMAYNQFIKKPNIENAATEMAFAQMQFQQDSLQTALKGNSKNLGFEQIITEYSGTPQANLARQYAGICYLNLGEFQKAIDVLTTYSKESGALGTIVYAQNLGLTGDAYSALENNDKALEYYEKAIASSDNIDTAPTYTFRAALINLEKGNTQKALEQFQNIKNSYPTSVFSRDIDKYISLASQK